MANIKLLTINSELKSAKTLGFATITNLPSCTADYDKDVIIRWGNSQLNQLNQNSWNLRDFKRVINTSNAIALNCDKPKAAQKLGEVVNTPKLFKETVPRGVTAVVRPINHSTGYGFSVQKGPYVLSYGFYATEFIETDTEYRVWFAGDKTIHGRRVNLDKKAKKVRYPCRSSWGYSYSYDDITPKDLHKQTLLAANKIGLTVGAADVLHKNGKYYFLELNSAASCDTNRIIKFYKTEILALIQARFPDV